MEDHTNTCRLAVSAAFSRGMPNFETIPPLPSVTHDVSVYHALPYGLHDVLRNRGIPEAIVDTTHVYETKHEALAVHKSQQNWLEVSQGLNSYLLAMEKMSLEIGREPRKFIHGEGWQRHLHLGFCVKDSSQRSERQQFM